MITLLLALALAQNTNQGPIIVQQNGTTQSGFRANTINCQAGVLCAQSGTVMTINALGGDGGTAPTNISGALPVTAISDAGNGFTIGLTVPTCNVSGSVLQYSAGVFSCVGLDAGTLKTITASSPLVATPDGGPGIDISFPSYQTTGALSLFLDPAGSDSNACTASGAATACLTWAGISSKVARFGLHNVVVTAATGSYTGGVDFSAIFVGGNYTLTSPLITATVASGTATGTSTAIVNSTSGESVLTDTGQSWTVNDLRGKFIAVGSATLVITSNTATTVNVIGTFVVSSPAAYTIQTTGANFSGALLFGNPMAIARPLATTGHIGVTGIGFVGVMSAFTNTRVDLTNLRIISATGGFSITQNSSNSRFSLVSSFVQSATAGPAANQFAGIGAIDFNQSFFYSTTSGGLTVSGYGTITLGSMEVEAATVNNSSPLVVWSGAYRNAGFFTTSRAILVKCAAGSTKSGFALYGAMTSTPISTPPGMPLVSMQLGVLAVSGCAIGVEVAGGMELSVDAYVSTSVATSVSVSSGSTFRSVALPTQTGATTELSIDGDPQTFESVRALPGRQVRNMLTNSTVVFQ